MARIDIRDHVKFDRTTVYETFRDKLAELQPYLPTIKEIDVDSYDRLDDTTVKIVNIWHASDGEIPTLASKFIKPEMLQWTDRATWFDDQHLCNWDMEVGFLKEAISCSGTTRYIEKGNGTEVHIEGQLKVDASKIPGVPRLVASKVGDAVEAFVIKMITPNMKEVNRGCERYLEKLG
jgi:hypothetical protein